MQARRRYGAEVTGAEVAVVEVVDVDVEVVVLVEVVVAGRLVVVVGGRVVLVVVDAVVLVDVEVAGIVSAGEESSPLRRASTTSAPAATTMAITSTVRPIAAHGDLLGGTGPSGPPGVMGSPGPP